MNSASTFSNPGKPNSLKPTDGQLVEISAHLSGLSGSIPEGSERMVPIEAMLGED